MRLARVLPVVAFLVLAGVAVWLLRADSARSSAAEPADPRSMATEAPVGELRAVDTAQTAPEREEVPAPVAEVPALPATVLGATTEPPGTLEVHGRVVVIDTDGREIHDADGTLTLVVWREEFGMNEDVVVKDGAWSLMLDGIGQDLSLADAAGVKGVSAADLRVDGKLTLVERPEDRFDRPFEGEFLVRARLGNTSVLRVVDATSGLDLTGIWIVSAKPFPDEDAVHPGPGFEKTAIARDLRSPIDLEEHIAVERYGSSRFLVGARGYAWERVEVDLRRGGERIASLSPGADLSVSVQAVEASANSRLRLRAAERSSPVVEVLLRNDGPVDLGGLPPGAYRVVAEIGEHWNSPISLGEVAVELRAHELTRAQLVLTAAPSFESAPVGGIVYVPQEWGLDDVMVIMELLDTPLAGFEEHQTFDARRVQSERAGFDAFRWSSKKMQVGRYELAVFEPSYSIVVDVPPGGRDDLELTIPPPIVFTVHVLDDATGEQVVTDELHWHSLRPDGVSGGGVDRAERADDGSYRIRAPETEIELMLWAWEYQPYNASVDLRLGVREHAIRLERGCGIVVKMLDGETQIPFPQDWWGELVAVGGSGHETLSQNATFERKFMVSEPGTYSLELPAISGYVRPPTLTIDVPAGRFIEHVVALERQY